MITLRELRKLARAVEWDITEVGPWYDVLDGPWDYGVTLDHESGDAMLESPFTYDPAIELWGKGATKAAAKAEARANAGIFLEAVGRMTYGGKAVRDE